MAKFFRLKKNKRKVALVLGLTFLLSVGFLIYFAESKLIRLVPGGWGESFSTRIYAAPFILENGSSHTLEEIQERLKILNYEPHPSSSLKPGQYYWSFPYLFIRTRGFASTHLEQESLSVKLTVNDENWEMEDNNAQAIERVIFEPSIAAELSGPEKVRRDPANWEEFPLSLIHAVVAIEDRRFFRHFGLDFRSILRAAWINLRTGKNVQGGSTITQQLAKNLFLTHKRTWMRKAAEAGLALYLDLRYSKEKILHLYLNHIYLGQDGFFSVAGMKAAARFYFNKDLPDLSLSESALLAGLIRSPFRTNPFENPETAKKRRDTVLRVMKDLDFIDEQELLSGIKQPLGVKRVSPNSGPSNQNDYFVAEVVRRMLPRYSEDMLFRYGLKIFTTMDPVFQSRAQKVVQKTKYQAALVGIDPNSGQVLCLVGGKNYQESQFNRATQAFRQPGSAFKPFVYGAALENGFTPASILEDKPRAYTIGKSKIWAPQNFDRKYRGKISLRQALAQSINGATLDLAEKIGLSRIIQFAQKCGVVTPLEKNLSTALGASAVSPFELTVAYLPFANGGFTLDPTIILSVEDLEGNVLESSHREKKSVIDPALAYLMTSLLESTIEEGTASVLKENRWPFSVAGKTGTTNNGKDAWFIGYSPTVLAGVWVGNDDAKPLNLSGTKDALPIWSHFMGSLYLDKVKPQKFEQPEGLVSVKIDIDSGLLSKSGCPHQKKELFIKGTEPSHFCDLHAGGIMGWFQRMFRKK